VSGTYFEKVSGTYFERVTHPWTMPAVEVRDLAVSEACAQAGGVA
jgi:hypothetical protein